MKDIESQCIIGNWITPRAPAPFLAPELIASTKNVFEKHGLPKEGLLVLPSIWRSSEAVYNEEITRERIEGVRKLGMTWEEMQESERLKFALHVQNLGIAIAWEEDQVPNLDVLMDC